LIKATKALSFFDQCCYFFAPQKSNKKASPESMPEWFLKGLLMKFWSYCGEVQQIILRQ
jgi:hypothetical protein